jgi:hypothetical protein
MTEAGSRLPRLPAATCSPPDRVENPDSPDSRWNLLPADRWDNPEILSPEELTAECPDRTPEAELSAIHPFKRAKR